MYLQLPITSVACACLITLLIASLKIIDNIDCFAGFNDLAALLLLNLKCRLAFCNKCSNDEISSSKIVSSNHQ